MKRPNLALPTRKLLVGLLVVSMASLAVGWTAGAVAASGGNRTAPSPAIPADKAISNPANLIDTGELQPGANTGTGTASAGSGLASGVVGGTSVAYPGPIYPGSLGAAPEGTILAGGSGTADMKVDGSDRASALPKATALALAEARTQAEAVATSMGVSLKAVYSVTVSTADSYAYPVQDCVVPPATPGASNGGSTGSSSGATPNAAGSGAPAIAPVPLPAVCNYSKSTTPASAQLVVTVVVAYRFA
jgi:hypothetical protein